MQVFKNGLIFKIMTVIVVAVEAGAVSAMVSNQRYSWHKNKHTFIE